MNMSTREELEELDAQRLVLYPVRSRKSRLRVHDVLEHAQWICDGEKMKLADNAIFTHPMPVDRGHEVTDKVASGPRSCIYDVAENRLHVQKAIMALTMGER